MILSPRSEKNMHGVHAKLVAVVRRAAEITDVDFVVTEGVRTLARQKELYAKGASRTLNSKHLTGHAVDLAAVVGTEVRWDWSCYYKLAEAMKQAAEDLGVDVMWGGNWKLLSLTTTPINARILSKSFPDGPHFEINPTTYP